MSVRLSVEVTLVTGLRARVRRMETPNQEGSSILTSYYQVLDPWFRSWRHQHDDKSTPSLTQNPLQHIYVCPSPPCKVYLDYHSIKSPGKDFGEGHWDCMIENPSRSHFDTFFNFLHKSLNHQTPVTGTWLALERKVKVTFWKVKTFYPLLRYLPIVIVRFGSVGVNCETTHIAKAAKNVSWKSC